MTHTQTPWTLATNDPTLIVTVALDSEGNCGVVADVLNGLQGDTCAANAAYIVECVNSHASLVEENKRMREALEMALSEIVELYRGIAPHGDFASNSDAVAAIRKALGDTNA